MALQPLRGIRRRRRTEEHVPVEVLQVAQDQRQRREEEEDRHRLHERAPLGPAAAAALAREGARVAGGARRVEQIEAEIALPLDVTDPDSCAAFVVSAVERLGGLDILVNNAGLARGREPVWEASEEDEREVVEANV